VLGRLGLYVKYGELKLPPDTLYVSVCCSRRRESLSWLGATASASACVA
jgi:hypothetical protein